MLRKLACKLHCQIFHPFKKKGNICSVQSSGSPDSQDLLQIYVSIGAIAVEHSFKIRGPTLSGPVVLCICNICNSFRTPTSDMSMSGIL